MTAPQPQEDFLAAIGPTEKAYRAVTIGYLAGRRYSGGPWQLIQAHITLEPQASERPLRKFESSRLRAGLFAASGPEYSPSALVAMLLRGEFPTEADSVGFQERDAGGYDLYMLRSYPDVATNTQNRMGLRIGGGWVQNAAPLNEVGWELLGADPPFETLQELADAFALGPVQQHSVTIELWTELAPEFCGLDRHRRNQATLVLRLAPALESENVRTGRSSACGTASDGLLDSKSLRWTSTEDGHHCVHRFVAVEHKDLLCTLQYEDAVQGFAVLRDNRRICNSRRLLYETVDPGLVKLAAQLDVFKAAEQNSDAFELLIARLFWLAGFSPLHLGKDKKTERASDIIALTPDEDVSLIECTTGILKKDKRSQLLRRAQILRDVSAQSPDGPRSVTPLLVTCLPWREAEADAKTHKPMVSRYSTMGTLPIFWRRPQPRPIR